MDMKDFAAKVVLTPMGPGRDEEFAEMLDEFRAAGEAGVYRGDFAVAWQGYSAFYSLLSQMQQGGFPRPEIVPMEAYFIESEGRILGELYLRRRLSPHLEQIGGHIGFKVRPSCRNRGVATAALHIALKKLGEMGIEKALVTCNSTNVASARVIEKCGGVRNADASLPEGEERRYWIETKS